MCPRHLEVDSDSKVDQTPLHYPTYHCRGNFLSLVPSVALQRSKAVRLLVAVSSLSGRPQLTALTRLVSCLHLQIFLTFHSFFSTPHLPIFPFPPFPTLVTSLISISHFALFSFPLESHYFIIINTYFITFAACSFQSHLPLILSAQPSSLQSSLRLSFQRIVN